MTFDLLKHSRVQEAWEYRTEPEALRTLAAVFWRGLLLVSFIVLVLALWFGWQELDAASQAENGNPSPTTAALPWTKAQLQSTLDALTQKQSAYQTLSHTALPAVADPSR